MNRKFEDLEIQKATPFFQIFSFNMFRNVLILIPTSLFIKLKSYVYAIWLKSLHTQNQKK